MSAHADVDREKIDLIKRCLLKAMAGSSAHPGCLPLLLSSPDFLAVTARRAALAALAAALAAAALVTATAAAAAEAATAALDDASATCTCLSELMLTPAQNGCQK